MSLPTLYERNLAKIEELQTEVQWAAQEWLRACDQCGITFRIIEAFRTQARQDQLYKQGRSLSGPIVTWTKKSLHTQRLAVDITPIKGTLEDIVSIAARYKIYRPPELVKLGDIGHLQFDKVSKNPPFKLDPRIEIRRLQREIDDEKNANRRARLLKRQFELQSLLLTPPV